MFLWCCYAYKEPFQNSTAQSTTCLLLCGYQQEFIPLVFHFSLYPAFLHKIMHWSPFKLPVILLPLPAITSPVVLSGFFLLFLATCPPLQVPFLNPLPCLSNAPDSLLFFAHSFLSCCLNKMLGIWKTVLFWAVLWHVGSLEAWQEGEQKFY